MSYEEEKRELRFAQRFTPTNPEKCWEWQGSFTIGKELLYGQFYWGVVNGKEKTISAHRASYLIYNGEIPDKLHVLHKCNNSKCVNPDHLYLGDHMQNMRDRNESGRTSRWDKRYNFVRKPEVVQKVISMRANGSKIKEIVKETGLSRTTVCRCLGKAA